MDCAQLDLIGYHLGTLGRDRDDVERHLLSCTPCLEAYLAVKRAADAGSRERPGPLVHSRLRRDVARMFPGRPGSRLRTWLTRPIPLYQTVAAAASLLLLGWVANAYVAHGRPSPTRGEVERIDTSRTTAESNSIY